MSSMGVVLEDFIRFAPVGIAIFDLEMRYRVVNEALAEMNGIPVEDHIGRTVREIVPTLEDQVEPIFRQLITSAQDHISFEVSGETARQPGVLRHWKETWFPIRTDEKTTAVAVFVEEITEARRAAEALTKLQDEERQRAEELQALMDSAPAAIWIAHDPHCERITGNAESYAVMEMPPHDFSAATPTYTVLRAQFREFRDGVRIPRKELPLQVATREGRPVIGTEMSLVFHDGHVRHLYGSAVPLRSKEGSVRGAIAAFIDVSTRKNAEEALRKADERKNQFIATLAHELRNPLSPVRNAAAILRVHGEDRERRTKAVDMIERQVAHMSHLLDDLLDVARITNNKLTLKKAPVAIQEVLNEAVGVVQPLIDAREHRIQISAPRQTLHVFGDRVRLTQILVNLLTNAAKYSPAGGRIAVSAQAGEAEVEIAVQDDGIGIAPEQLPKVFEMFAQVEDLHGVDGGLGIGLSLSRALVEMHLGKIEASSEGLGCGSRFSIRLPLLQGTAERSAEPVRQDEPRITRRHSVLVVDDNADSADSLAMLLQMEGHEVSVAYDGDTAIRLCRDRRPHAVVLDIGMPKMDGYEVARRIRAECDAHPIRLIALTGFGQDEDQRRASAAGFDLHLTKPVDPNLLLNLFC